MDINEKIREALKKLNDGSTRYHFYRYASRIWRKEVIGDYEYVQSVADISCLTDDDFVMVDNIVDRESGSI